MSLLLHILLQKALVHLDDVNKALASFRLGVYEFLHHLLLKSLSLELLVDHLLLRVIV